MNYAEIKTYDVANGPGIRLSLFVSGCPHRCPGCFNQQAWDFSYGKPFTNETINYIIKELSFPAYAGITFLGGEPFAKENQHDLLLLAKKLKKLTLIKTYGAIPVMNLNGTLWDICMINGHTQKNLCHILTF